MADGGRGNACHDLHATISDDLGDMHVAGSAHTADATTMTATPAQGWRETDGGGPASEDRVKEARHGAGGR